MHLVMKLSKLCNLRCTYCYEYDELSHKEQMPLDGIEFFFKSVAEYVLSRNHPIPIDLVLHGGEPLLLPPDYLRAVCTLRDKYFGANGIAHTTAVQSNLFQISDKKIDLLEELNISLGISLDVFGEQRVDIAGRVSQEKVLDNLQRLLDRNFPIGGIVVLHALNINKAVNIYEFYNKLGITFRFLPIFSQHNPPERMAHLMLSFEAIVAAFQKVAKAQFAAPSRIEVLPLKNYFEAAVRYLAGHDIGVFIPSEHEWVLIINTNGDTYSHGDPYSAAGYMGNIFQQSLAEIFTSKAYANATKIRMERGETCRRCQFDRKCNQIDIVEAIPSERFYDEAGVMQCSVAKPMIQFMVDEIQRSPQTQALINLSCYQEEPLSLLRM